MPFTRVGFVSTRIAGTDGVSLEIAKWAAVLERNGCRCFYFAGESDREAARSFLVPEAHFEHPAVRELSERLFGATRRSRALSGQVHELAQALKAELYAFCERFQLDLLVPENALTLPMNLPLGLALTEFIAETGTPTLAHHHDFYWERERFLVNACQDYLDQAFPPGLPSMRHVVINSLAAVQLSHRRGLTSTVIPNVYDFAHEPAPGAPCALREEIDLAPQDPFLLQPTRVVPRKWIERSIELVHRLNLANPTLVISHAGGDEGKEYGRVIAAYARSLGVRLVFIDELVGGAPGQKPYTLADAYRCADLVLYPSGYEGFGNAFLEAVYYQRPILVNRYPVFIADIEPKGFEVIKIDGMISSKTVEQVQRALEDEAHRQAMVKRNYAVALEHFSFEVLEERLRCTLSALSTQRSS